MITTSAPTEPPVPASDLVDVCGVQDLLTERAAAALVDGVQVALAKIPDGRVFAVGQFDPFCDANVMSRGLVGSVRVGEEDVPTIQSPMYKQAFDLRTGVCLGEDTVCLGSWEVHVCDGRVLVGAMTRRPSGVGPAGRGEAAREADAANRAVVDGTP